MNCLAARIKRSVISVVCVDSIISVTTIEISQPILNGTKDNFLLFFTTSQISFLFFLSIIPKTSPKN